jgi:hypothetical protein
MIVPSCCESAGRALLIYMATRGIAHAFQKEVWVGLVSATIRNVMSDLEGLGLIVSPPYLSGTHPDCRSRLFVI